MVDTHTIVNISLLRMDVEDVEETAVAYQQTHADHRPVICRHRLVFQHFQGYSIAKAHSIHLWQIQ